jgi:hypothetical protein
VFHLVHQGTYLEPATFDEILNLLEQKCKPGSDGPPVSFLGLKNSMLSQECGRKLLKTLKKLSKSDDRIHLELREVFSSLLF